MSTDNSEKLRLNITGIMLMRVTTSRPMTNAAKQTLAVPRKKQHNNHQERSEPIIMRERTGSWSTEAETGTLAAAVLAEAALACNPGAGAAATCATADNYFHHLATRESAGRQYKCGQGVRKSGHARQRFSAADKDYNQLAMCETYICQETGNPEAGTCHPLILTSSETTSASCTFFLQWKTHVNSSMHAGFQTVLTVAHILDWI